jgi:HPt (histidine-containing phosphotransfer) domain-containing protein
MNNQELAEIVMAGFFEEIPELILRLHKSATQGDAPNVVALAHHIKGASANLGANALSQIAARIEKLAKQGDILQVTALMSELHAEIDRFMECLQAFRTKSPNWTHTSPASNGK